MNKKRARRTISQGRKSSPKSKPAVVTANQVRNLVAKELQDRNRPEIAYLIPDILLNIGT